MSKKLNVVIVGRTNVGKSTLFNRLSNKVKSITLDYEGVTRDFIKETISWQGKVFDIVDTGGVSLRKNADELMEKSRQIALDMINDAGIILFVCDGTVGIVSEDREIAKLLHKSGKKVVLIINKMDSKVSHEKVYEFDRLGFKPILQVSAEHSTGIGDVLETICLELPEGGIEKEEEDPGCKVVFLGKPNVGKSSLMNLILNKERSMVTDIAGTTREAISEKISFYQEDILVTDTPGIRKKHSVTEDLESMMVKSSFRALQHADIVLLLVDASAGKISDQELKLAFYSFTQQYKALIILFNKQDLTTEKTQDDMEYSLEEYTYMMKKIPTLNISCISGKNVGKVLPLVKEVWVRSQQKFSDEELTVLFKTELEKKPHYHKTIPLIVYKAKLIKNSPITIVLVVNEWRWFGPAQLTFFENIMRRTYKLIGVPVKFIVRKRG